MGKLHSVLESAERILEQTRHTAVQTLSTFRQKVKGSNGGTEAGKQEASYQDRSKQELYEAAKQLNIEGRSKMTKQQLIEAIERHQ
mgnify:CR=1 FL=1